MHHPTVNEVLNVLEMPTIEQTQELLAGAEFSREVICDERVSKYSLWPEHFEQLRESGLEHQLRTSLELYTKLTDLRDFVLIPRACERAGEMHALLELNGFHPSQWFMFGSVAAGRFHPGRSDIDIGVVMPESECEDGCFIELLKEHNLPGVIPLHKFEMRVEVTRYSKEWMARRLERETSTSRIDMLVMGMLRDGGARVPLRWD